MKERKKELTQIINENNELAEKGCVESQQIVINAQIELDDLANQELARLEKILSDVRNSNESAEMPEVHRNHEEPSFDPYR